MSQLSRLKQVKTLEEFAKLLGYTPSGFSFVLYRMPETTKYNIFEVPKKNGGNRTIKAPSKQLALLQKRLLDLLSDCVDELAKDDPRYWLASHGFRKGRTIVSNANPHR